MAKDIKKVVLAYSGGLDTSIILKWLQTTYGCEVVTFTADLGQGEELEPAREKALMLGIKPENIFIEDLREEFVRDFVFPMFRANALYEGAVPARHLDRAAADRQEADRDRRARSAPTRSVTAPPARATTRCASSSPITRSSPSIKIIAPWREWSFKGRDELLEFAREAPDPDRQGQGGRGAVLGRRQPAALLLRGQGAGGPGQGSRRRSSISAPSRRWRRPTRRPTSASASRRATRCQHRRQGAVAGDAADAGSTSSAATTASAASTWSRTASSA